MLNVDAVDLNSLKSQKCFKIISQTFKYRQQMLNVDAVDLNC